MRSIIALVACAALLCGCATARPLRPVAGHDQDQGRRAAGTVLLAEYVQSLPVGTTVKVERTAGGSMTGTLMKTTDQYIVLQRRTRLPEPPEQIAMDQILRVTPASRNGLAKAVGIGAAAGGAAALGMFLVVLAIYAD